MQDSEGYVMLSSVGNKQSSGNSIKDPPLYFVSTLIVGTMLINQQVSRGSLSFREVFLPKVSIYEDEI